MTPLAGLALPFALAAAPVADFAALRAALVEGHEVRAVIDYHQCQLIEADAPTGPGPQAIGGMSLLPWELFETGVVRNDQPYVAASEARLISHPTRGTVYNHVKLRLWADGHVDVVARYLDPRSFKIVMDETFRCDLQQGVRLFVGPS